MLPEELQRSYETSITIDGLTYSNSVAAFEALKCLYLETRQMFIGASAEQAVDIANSISEDLKLGSRHLHAFQYNVECAKFEQNPDLLELLLRTDVSEDNLLTQVKSALRPRDTITVTTYYDIEAYCREHEIPLDEFDENIIIPNGTKDCSRLLDGQKKFNGTISIPDSVEVMDQMFYKCTSFNRPVKLPANLKTARFAFNHCTSFNRDITIPKNLIEAPHMFSSCACFDSSVTVEEGSCLKNAASMFHNCLQFNKPVKLHPGVLRVDAMFSGCIRYNQEFVIPNTVTDVRSLFDSCRCFNQKVIIPESVEVVDSILSDCASYNKPIDFSKAISANYSLANCTSFNCTVAINPEAVSIQGMLAGCKKFDQPLLLPEKADCSNLLMDCKSFKQPLTLLGTMKCDGILIGASSSGAWNIKNYTNSPVQTGYLSDQIIPPDPERQYRPFYTFTKQMSEDAIIEVYTTMTPPGGPLPLADTLYQNLFVQVTLEDAGATTDAEKELLWRRLCFRLDNLYLKYLNTVDEEESMGEFSQVMDAEMEKYKNIKRGIR